MNQSEIDSKLKKAWDLKQQGDKIEEEVADHFRVLLEPLLKKGKFHDAKLLIHGFTSESIHKFDLISVIFYHEEEWKKKKKKSKKK